MNKIVVFVRMFVREVLRNCGRKKITIHLMSNAVTNI